jgi:hypothetical protein
MGEGRVLLFSDSGVDVGAAISRRVWWEGLITDLGPWDPNMVSNKREVWVRIYGFPLQVWGEKAFSLFTKPWSIFIGLDEETRQKSRFDVARVKILTSALETIDTTSKIKVQEVEYAVRVIEEGGGPLEFVHYTKEEDQIGWSVVGSSCDSVGRGPAAAMAEGVVSDGFVSDSDGSEQEQLETTGSVKTLHGNEVVNSFLKQNKKELFDNTESGGNIPSKSTKNKTIEEDKCTQVVREDSEAIRGLSTSMCGDQEVVAAMGNRVDHEVGSPLMGSKGRDLLKSNGLRFQTQPGGPLTSPFFLVGGSGHGGLITKSKVGQVTGN